MSCIHFVRSAALFVIATVMLPAAYAASAKLDLQDPQQRVSYVIGAGIGTNLKAQALVVDADAVAAGIADAIAGTLQLTEADIAETMEQVRSELTARQQAERRDASTTNAKAGTEYLTHNAKQPGVVTTASGLQYKVVKSGTGATPGLKDKVKVHYHGTRIDGTVFDSTVKRGQPVTFSVNGVIAGWTEALQLMKVGDKWQITIPPNLAYGEKGIGSAIGPNTVLIFDLELLDVEK